jgi:hypothetical protein
MSARWAALGLCMILGGCVTTDVAQLGDHSFQPVVELPAYDLGTGPVVLVDAAHGNFHTIEGRYAVFARLLEADGFIVRSAEKIVTPDLLAGVDVFVISNAVKGGSDAEWVLPTPSAFTTDEIQCIQAWVADGGSLLLIADHMPMPGATARLAAAFGVVFYNGFAMLGDDRTSVFTMNREDGTLADHPITRGRNDREYIESVMLFTGQAFRVIPGATTPVDVLLTPPTGTEVLLPVEAWEFSDATPRVSAAGLHQGIVFRHGAGRGRVAMFGEAAMFTAQTQVRGDVVRHMGINHPDATDNQQFVLNVMHWLTGLLDKED